MRLRGYDGPIRQIAVTGLGRERPTLFLSNNFEETPRELIIRYAGRNRVEGGLGVSVNFFHLDCLASEVRLNVDLDAALTVIANGCYRWLASRLQGFEKADPKQLYRRFVETAGTVIVQPDRLTVAFDRRSSQPDPPRGGAGPRLAARSRGSASGDLCSPTADPDSRPRFDYFPGLGNRRSTMTSVAQDRRGDGTCTRTPPVLRRRPAGTSAASRGWPQQLSSGSRVIACQRAPSTRSSVCGSGPGSACPAAIPDEQQRVPAPGSTLGGRSQTEVVSCASVRRRRRILVPCQTGPGLLIQLLPPTSTTHRSEVLRQTSGPGYVSTGRRSQSLMSKRLVHLRVPAECLPIRPGPRSLARTDLDRGRTRWGRRRGPRIDGSSRIGRAILFAYFRKARPTRDATLGIRSGVRFDSRCEPARRPQERGSPHGIRPGRPVPARPVRTPPGNDDLPPGRTAAPGPRAGARTRPGGESGRLDRPDAPGPRRGRAIE